MSVSKVSHLVTLFGNYTTMTQATPKDYWISPRALYIELNATGNSDYIQASCVSGAQILVYIKGVIGYDSGHNYRRWPLQAAPTIFNTHSEKYVYVAIPKSEASDVPALVVFPSEPIDLYGKNADGAQIGPNTYYYIFTQGIISSSGDNGATLREWQSDFETGTLSSDEAISASGGEGQWWEYNSVMDGIKFLKNIIEATFSKLTATWASITQLILGGHSLTGVAKSNVQGDNDTPDDSDDTVVTPKYATDKYVHRYLSQDIWGDKVFKNTTLFKKGVIVGVFHKDTQVGIGAKEGVYLGPEGGIIAKSLELSESLNVPALKYNQIEVLSGTRWDSAGKGRIREVVSIDDSTHTCAVILDLNEGEPGEFLADDILRGFWHNTQGQNATANSDDRHGNIERAGFQSLYCRVLSVEDVVERTDGDTTIFILKNSAGYTPQDGDVTHAGGHVTLQMRQYDADGAATTWAPYPSRFATLSVSGSFSPAHPERQKFFVHTTSYMARYADVNTWEWQDSNFKGGWGDLTGFKMIAQAEDGSLIEKNFTGEALASGDLYIYGVLDQFTRFSDSLQIILSRPDGVVSNNQSIRADFILRDVERNIIQNGYTLTVTRQSGDATADADWNAAHSGSFTGAMYFSKEDVPGTGAVFIVKAERQVGDKTYVTSSAFTLSLPEVAEVYTLHLSLAPSICADGTLAEGETAVLSAKVLSSVGQAIQGFAFAIVRETDNAMEDSDWNASHTMANGRIDLTIGDLGIDNATFIVKATQTQGNVVYCSLESRQVITRVTKQSLSIDLGQDRLFCKPGEVDVAITPLLLSGVTDITKKTLESDWLWIITTNEASFDNAWNEEHKSLRVLKLTDANLPESWHTQSPITLECVCNYRGVEVRSIADSTRAYPKFRQGETFYLDLDIDFGTDNTFDDSDFTVEAVDVTGYAEQWPFVRSASNFNLQFDGLKSEKMRLGKYRVTLWYHKGQPGQECIDFDPAFELVETTELKTQP